MYRWVRTVTPQAGKMGDVRQVGKDITDYINSSGGMDTQFFMERFGKIRFHWSFDAETISEIEAALKKMESDDGYLQKVAALAPLLLAGHTHDTVVESI